MTDGRGAGLRLAVIPGDGIGPEVVAEAVKVLQAAVPRLEVTTYDLGAARWQRSGELLPDSVLAEIQQHEAILLGALGNPTEVPNGIVERGLLQRLRVELDHHVNIRPIRLFDGVDSPLAGAPKIDVLVVREGGEGPYADNGGFLRKDSEHEVATEVSLNTAYGVGQVVRDAFGRAARRSRRSLTLVHKTSVLTHAGSLWSRIVEETALRFPEVSVDYQPVDAAVRYFVTEPDRFDVVVTDSLFGEILTDLGAAIAGGLSLAASGSLDVSGGNPSLFSPVHGSAPDIAGQGVADPTATVLCAALLLDQVGRSDQARRLEAAVAFDLATRDRKSTDRTEQIGDRLAALVSSNG